MQYKDFIVNKMKKGDGEMDSRTARQKERIAAWLFLIGYGAVRLYFIS